MAPRLMLWFVAQLALVPTLLAQPPAQPEAPEAPVPIDLWSDFPRLDASVAFQSLEGAWPERAGPHGRSGVIVELPQRTLRPEGFRVGWSESTDREADRADAASLLGEDGAKAVRIKAESIGSFVVRVPAAPEGERLPRRKLNPSSLTFRFVSGQEESPGVVRLERTYFSYFPPTPAPEQTSRPPRALVVLMPGMFATPEPILSAFTNDLTGRGYAVLRMIAQPARFTEHMDLRLDAAGDIAGVVARATHAFDSRQAECAYAVKAALEFLARKRPETAGVPRAIAGFSAGAITLPTVVAFDPDTYRAAIVVGGGGDWWLMNERSNYRSMIDAVSITWTNGPTRQALEKAGELYLSNARLDSFNTAQALRDVPTLFIQGKADLAVPSPLGDVLWERAGKPERWLMEGGHEVLFMQLPRSFDRIAAWLEDSLGARKENP